MRIIEKAVAFFDLKKKKQLKKQQKLEKIIRKLVSKARGVKKRYKKATDDEKKIRLLKEYKVLINLLHKSHVRLKTLKENSKTASLGKSEA